MWRAKRNGVAVNIEPTVQTNPNGYSGEKTIMTTAGYLEGADPLTLTRLNLQGIGTLPLGNGFDGHGKYIGHLTKADGIRVVISYLHKILPTGELKVAPRDFLFACNTHGIDVLLVVPEEGHAKANELLGEIAEWVTLVAPEKLYDEVVKRFN